jgi:outer membrane protein OmpA-like peptidoglycan-associated protein
MNSHSSFSSRAARACGLMLSTVFAGTAFAALDPLPANWPDLNLRATLATGTSPEVEQGSNLQLRISADEEASFAVIMVNAEGQARVSIPRRDESQARIVRGTETLFPDLLAGETLYADMTVGKGYIYVVASERPIFRPDDASASQWQDAAALRARIAAAVGEGSGTRVSASRLPLYVVAPQMKEFISEDEFVEFFAVATRSMSNPSRGFKIGFEHDSAELSDWSRRQLDAVVRGMQKDALTAFRFKLEGHTDDVGEDAYNMDLSARRAASVRSYLVGKGVAAGRLETGAMGESAPAMPGTSDKAREQNRRVVIRRLDTGN